LAPLIYPTKEVVGDFNITIIIFAIDIAKQVCGAQGCNNIIFRSYFSSEAAVCAGDTFTIFF